MPEWCLVTGASGGLGAAFAREAAREGFDLVLSARNEQKLDALATEIRAMRREVVVIPSDLSRPGAGEALWQAANQSGEVGMLVNNAGLGVHGPIHDPAIAELDRATIAVNVTAAADLQRAAATDMAARGRGRILNVASSAAFMPGPSMASYHASKAFLLYLSEAASIDLAGTGVTVTALCPGPTATGFFDAGNVRGALALRILPKADAARIARIGWRAAMSGRRMVTPGLLYKLIGFGMRFTPRALALQITRLYWRK